MAESYKGEKIPLALAERAAKKFAAGMKTKHLVCGSIRRRKSEVGDIDIVSVGVPSTPTHAMFMHGGEVNRTYLFGGVQVNVFVTTPECLGAALLYATGSGELNMWMRGLAKSKGWKLNQYGLWDGEKRLAGRTEAGIFAKLGLTFLPPELRGSDAEVEVAEVKSSSQEGLTYHLRAPAQALARQLDPRVVTCECTGFQYRHTCTHVRKALLALAGIKQTDVTLTGCGQAVAKRG